MGGDNKPNPAVLVINVENLVIYQKIVQIMGAQERVPLQGYVPGARKENTGKMNASQSFIRMELH